MLARIILFFSSYVPLFVIFGIRFPSMQIYCYALAAFFVLAVAWLLLRVLRNHEPQLYRVRGIADDGSGAAYIATYILPFVTVGTPSTRDLLAYAVFLLVACALTVRSSLIGVNPLILLSSWHIYQLTTDGGRSVILLAHDRPGPDDTIRAAPGFPGLLVRKDDG